MPETITDMPKQKYNNMYYRRIGISTELWTCVHDVGYPDICEECVAAKLNSK